MTLKRKPRVRTRASDDMLPLPTEPAGMTAVTEVETPVPILLGNLIFPISALSQDVGKNLASFSDAMFDPNHFATTANFFAGLMGGSAAPVHEVGHEASTVASDPAVDTPREGRQRTGREAGQFISGSTSNAAGTRDYKLYIPSAYTGQALPLVVMLHACSQDPDDFATGTDMNAHAEAQPCLVLYPAQAPSANGSRCWNWYKSGDQQRDQGEPSIIADMTRHVIKTYNVNPSQVFVAGMSAGGAMAIIMGRAYPDLYAAVGIHSGVPYASAQDLQSAMATMQNGAADYELAPASQPASQASLVRARARLMAIPVIIFHGDRDTTVNPRNSHQIMTQWTGLTDSMLAREDSPLKIEQGRVPNGHAYTRTIHHNEDGDAIAEQWLVHGAGHAWSGGSRLGSFTDVKGPDASREMMRFFAINARPDDCP